MAVEQRPDDAAVQDAVERGVMGERLPIGPQLARLGGAAGGLVALDPETLGIGRPAPEASGRGGVPSLEPWLGHERESSRGRQGGSLA